MNKISLKRRNEEELLDADSSKLCKRLKTENSIQKKATIKEKHVIGERNQRRQKISSFPLKRRYKYHCKKYSSDLKESTREKIKMSSRQNRDNIVHSFRSLNITEDSRLTSKCEETFSNDNEVKKKVQIATGQTDGESLLDMDTSLSSQKQYMLHKNGMDEMLDSSYIQKKNTKYIINSYLESIKCSGSLERFPRVNYMDDLNDDGIWTDFEDDCDQSYENGYYDYESLYSENTLDAISNFNSEDEA